MVDEEFVCNPIRKSFNESSSNSNRESLWWKLGLMDCLEGEGFSERD